ncbi:hypothetical protein BEWA_023130 [Theileria equi strain WA]|uniref:Uncharacterized protein n=1 Tax=Theileria equi strain WA TaxID=1537102 RepID=L0AX54_THEEQ|nr:hypothetical protein BEWA_023130 [Theileria equi strain WA]AFZ79464.1 hypothetical protein BEWA_023130 [Theileria equi strain WA]|eukprot:XP_004829130.1 hypothetical protein BEWA_023130 [Theileria equi strain WA]
MAIAFISIGMDLQCLFIVVKEPKMPTQVDTHKYTKRKHRLQTSPPNFSVSSFIGSSGNKLQTGLSSISNVTEVNVFWYPNDGSSKPLLINYQLSNEHKWYKKTKVANTWKEVSEKDLGKPTSPSDQAKIKKLLIGASSPEVTIKIEQVPGSSYISDDQTVKIDRTGAADANGYSQITHRIDGKTFIIKSVTHGDNLQTVQGTTTFSKDPLTEVSVFYSDFDSKLSKPLLLELKLHNTQTTYKYYEKTKKQMNGSYLTRNKETNMLEIL